MNERSQELRDQIKAFELPKKDKISVNLVNRHNRKAEFLINNTDSRNAIKPRNQAYYIEFKRPIYVHSIELNTEDILSYKRIEIGWGTSSGKAKSDQRKALTGGVFRLGLSDVISRNCGVRNCGVRSRNCGVTNCGVRSCFMHVNQHRRQSVRRVCGAVAGSVDYNEFPRLFSVWFVRCRNLSG